MSNRLFGSNCKAYNYKNDVPDFIANADSKCLPFNVKILVPDAWKKSKCRVLCVIEHVDSIDIEKKRLCSGTYGTVLENTFKLADDYIKHLDPQKYVVGVANFNYFRTYHIKNVKLRDQADQAAAKRIRSLIKTLQPHKVIVFGDRAAEQLIPNVPELRLLRGHKHEVNGVEYYSTIDPSVGYSKSKNDDDEDSGNVSDLKEETTLKYCNLLGYTSRTVAAALLGRIPYKIEVKPKPVLIDTVKKFDKLYKKLMTAKVLACDIETDDLSRVTNRLLTVQFAFDSKVGFVVPIFHKDSPFSKTELKHIRKRLRKFFAKDRDYLSKQYDEYIIGQNFKFDMSVLRHWLKINQILWPIWDLQSGEYALDENIVTLKDKSKFGTPQYNLLQISLNYGCFAYLEAKFGKSERHTISQVDLNQDVLEYCALDVQAPFAIHEQQLKRARRQRFGTTNYQEAYRKFVVTQMNNMVHITSQMEQRGACIDLPYLMKMRSAKGPLEQLLQSKLAEFKKSKAAKKANKLLLERSGAPSGSIYEAIGAKSDNWVLNLNKPIHKQVLFVDVLGLKPKNTTASGAPQIDKYFMAAHKDVPEAALYDEYSQLVKLSGTYIGAFARRYQEEKDFRSDGHLRPSFGFVETATGRGNSYDPNLQNIPTRGKFAKMIKRSFVAPHGSLRLKMDYSAHEVRVWAIIAGDELLAALFQRGRELRQKFRGTENPKYKALMDTIGDIHKLNCQFFFGVEPAEVTKEQRDSIKNVVFGSIYGRSAGSIGKVINKDKEYVEKLLDRFFDRFKKASAWLKWAKQHSVQHNYVYSPIGRVRHMYAHLYGMQGLVAATERRGSNAPIQGFAADMGHTAAYIYGIHMERVLTRFERMDGLIVPGGVSVMVHDSIFGDMNYQNYLIGLQVMQWCATLGCEQYYETHFGVKYPVHLEVEFELGCDDSRLIKWDWSETQLKEAIEQSLVYQTEIYPKLDVKKTLKEIYAVRNDTKLMKYLDKNYPILSD